MTTLVTYAFIIELHTIFSDYMINWVNEILGKIRKCAFIPRSFCKFRNVLIILVTEVPTHHLKGVWPKLGHWAILGKRLLLISTWCSMKVEICGSISCYCWYFCQWTPNFSSIFLVGLHVALASAGHSGAPAYDCKFSIWIT